MWLVTSTPGSDVLSVPLSVKCSLAKGNSGVRIHIFLHVAFFRPIISLLMIKKPSRMSSWTLSCIFSYCISLPASFSSFGVSSSCMNVATGGGWFYWWTLRPVLFPVWGSRLTLVTVVVLSHGLRRCMSSLHAPPNALSHTCILSPSHTHKHTLFARLQYG